MTDLATTLILLGLACVAIGWLLPRDWAMDAIAAFTALALAILAPVSAAWLLGATILTPLILKIAERTGRKNLGAAAPALALMAGFAAAQLETGLVLVGVGFFTLRHLHVIGDWWMGQISPPKLREHLRYQLFLPVLVVGPINRLPRFNREVERRRWDGAEFAIGMERALVGAFMALPIGGWLIPVAQLNFGLSQFEISSFGQAWAASAFEWTSLYFVFAGLTGVALGTSRMLGLTLEENFNQPWRATSLLDFWRRWHMTLSNWVLDYVFRPVAAITRQPFVGLVAAMLAIGLWHEFSSYYVLWSFWQVLGIVLTRLANKLFGGAGPPRWASEFALPLSVLVWLTLSRPVVTLVLEVIQ